MRRTSFRTSLAALIATLPARRHKQFAFLAALMLFGGLAEVLSLGAIVPFLAILAEPHEALQKPIVAYVVAGLGLSRTDDLRWQLTLLFAGAAMAAGFVRFALIIGISKINSGIGHELECEVYRRALCQPYEVHITQNSSEILGGINKVDVVLGVMVNLLTAASALLMAIFIVAALIYIDPFVTIPAIVGLGVIYIAVSIFTKKKLRENSGTINAAYNLRVQCVQEGLGGIRDVLLEHAQPVFAARFKKVDLPLRQAQASNNIIGPAPRFAVEALGMVLIALLGYHMTGASGIASAIPTLGALALGVQRLMPLLQQIYQGWVYVAGNRYVIDDVLALLRKPVPEINEPSSVLPFAQRLEFAHVYFKYNTGPLVLQNINLTILRGARVGIIGDTGSGKSTTMDLLMGLLRPTSGHILVDGTQLSESTRLSWQRNVAHVPQSIFLADASFAENIAFGWPPEQIDLTRVREAARQAQISDFIESYPGKYDAALGERGIRLSGGQRQRIGIARALYKQAEVLVFDEATSSLDTETEVAVMDAINSLGRDVTIVLIAHRFSTLRACDVIYRLDHGKIAKFGTYEQLVADALSPISS